MKNGKNEKTDLAKPDQFAEVLPALNDAGLNYEQEMETQNESIVPVLPAVKSLKEYKNFVYETGVDDEGEPMRTEITDVTGLIVFNHAMRALFYDMGKDFNIWRLFPHLDQKKVLEDYKATMPLCSAIGGIPNREFRFADRCDACPLNCFGSSCKPKERLFMFVDCMTPDGPLKNELVTLALPTTSLKWFTGKNGYLNELRNKRTPKLPKGIPLIAVWTAFDRQFVTNDRKFKFHEVHMKIARVASKDEVTTALKMREEIQRVWMKIAVTDYAGPDAHSEDNGYPFGDDKVPPPPPEPEHLKEELFKE